MEEKLHNVERVLAESERAQALHSLRPKLVFPLSEEAMRVELDNSHKYYMEALKMSLKIPAAALVAQFTLISMYGFLLRGGVEAKNASRGLADLMEVLLLALPGLGIMLSIAFIILQFVAREAMLVSTRRYLQPNRRRLSLPIPPANAVGTWKADIEKGVHLLFIFGYMLSLGLWLTLIAYARVN